MPFKSKSQRAWMHANKPGMAEEWEEETPKGKELPDKVPEEGASKGLSKWAKSKAKKR